MRFIGACRVLIITELVFCSFVAAEQLPKCRPLEKMPPTSSVVRAPEKLELTKDDSLVWRARYDYEIVLEVEYDESGHLVCANPLAGLELHWPYAIDAVSRVPPASLRKPGRNIVIFDDPGGVGTRASASFDDKDGLRCTNSDKLDAALEVGTSLMARNRHKEALQCFIHALNLSPNSLAANEGAAVCSGVLRQTGSRIQYLERTVALRPLYFEAKIELGRAYHHAGQFDKAVQTLREVIEVQPPLPTLRQLYRVLIFMYDRADLRREAMEASRSFLNVLEDLRNRYPPLVKAYELAFDGGELALRLEEQGLYSEAEENYRKAAGYSKDKLVSEAVLFDMELGRARGMRRRGENATATTTCDYWRRRIRSLGRKIENAHWGGRVLAQAQWECSCGDLAKGLEMIRAEAKRRPDSDMPYLLLSKVHRARGESSLAKLAQETGERIRTEHDQRIINAILEEAEQLYRLGGARKIK